MRNCPNKSPESLKLAALYKSIPNAYQDVTVGATSGTVDFKSLDGSNLDVTGQYVRLKAVDADLTILRGTHTLTDGAGLVLANGEEEEFYVDPDGDTVLSHIAGGASKTLRVFYSAE